MKTYAGALVLLFVAVGTVVLVTVQCAVCHGANLQGMGDVAAIADRTVSYTVRQLYNYQQGTRQSQLMKPVVLKLDPDEMIAIAAYLASL